MDTSNNVLRIQESENYPTFEQVIDENQNKIQNLIYNMTNDYQLAQDLTQETFIKAFKAIKSFEGKSKISTWLYRIAVNITIDYQRKNNSKKEAYTDLLENVFSSSDEHSDPDQACQKNGIKEILFNTIAQLPDQQREVFVLREINGCSTKEAAELLGISVELVKWRLHKARLALRKTLSSNIKHKNAGTFKLTSQGLE